MAIHSSGQTVFSLPHIEGITLGEGEEVDQVVGGKGALVYIGYVRLVGLRSRVSGKEISQEWDIGAKD